MIKKLIISIFIFIFLLFPLKANQLKQITKINLSNDLTVLLQEDRRINLIALEFFLKTGLEEENEQISGINNLIANMLFKGTNKYTAIEINQKIELMGNTLNAQAYPDYILINALGSKENFPALLNLIVHCLNNPIFPEDEFKKVKEEILKKKEGSKSIFYALYENFLQNFYRYHPYRYPQEGYVKSLKNLTSKDLKEYYQTYFIPNKMVLSI
ncbi:MAG: insulinase family protein, partial [Armatimonadetes bacterium]|nr:insulinase family protein [Armatimonadota bacterium]